MGPIPQSLLRDVYGHAEFFIPGMKIAHRNLPVAEVMA
jgi:hypothetical protein